MKRLIVSLILVSAGYLLHAQPVVREIPFNDFTLSDVAPSKDGYYAVAHYERLSVTNQIGTRYYTPALIRLDKNFKPQWEVVFGESKEKGFISMAISGDKIFVGGKKERLDGAGTIPWMLAFDPEGTLLWEKHILPEGCDYGNSVSVHALPGGDIIWMGKAAKGNNGILQPTVLRTSPEGIVRWQERYIHKDYEFFLARNPFFTADGNMVLASEGLPRQVQRGWPSCRAILTKIDLTTGAMLFTKWFDVTKMMTCLGGGWEVQDGSLALVGYTASTVGEYSYDRTLFIHASADGEVISFRNLNGYDYSKFQFTLPVAWHGYHVASGHFVTNDPPALDGHHLSLLDKDFNVVTDLKISGENFRNPKIGLDGSLITIGDHKLVVISMGDETILQTPPKMVAPIRREFK